jgi:hypothetical protein
MGPGRILSAEYLPFARSSAQKQAEFFVPYQFYLSFDGKDITRGKLLVRSWSAFQKHLK